jgi:hypothetical protein
LLFVKAKKLKRTLSKHRQEHTPDLTESAATAKLLQEKTLEAIPSVTERTTGLTVLRKEERRKTD